MTPRALGHSIRTSFFWALPCSCSWPGAEALQWTRGSLVEKVRRRCLRRIDVCLVFVALLRPGVTGCGGPVRPPANVRDPVPIYVTDYGRHSTLLLPTDDGRLEEFAFGDWDWLAAY